MRSRVVSVALTTALVITAAFWLVQEWFVRIFGVTSKDNCFTWAARNWNYSNKEFIAIGKSQSAWFPHVVIFRDTDSGVERVEYVPKIRENKTIPPRKFNGYVKTTKFTRSEP